MTIYSYSRLKCFEQCPQKYKFQYIDKVRTELKESVELFIGKRVHETLKKLYQDLWYQKMNTLEDLLVFLHKQWAKKWDNSVMIVKKNHAPIDYLRMAEQYIRDYYYQYHPFDQGRTIALEKRILVNLDDSFNEYKLCGYIDRITKTNDGYYEIHDYKTCSRLSSPEYIQNDRQLALYALCLKVRYTYIKNVRLIWNFLKFNKEFCLTWTGQDLEELKKDVIQLINTIEDSKEFPAKPSRLCDWCKFKTLCRQ